MSDQLKAVLNDCASLVQLWSWWDETDRTLL